MKTLRFLYEVINYFFSTHNGMWNGDAYGAHRVGKHGVACLVERHIVCTMANDTKRWIMLENT